MVMQTKSGKMFDGLLEFAAVDDVDGFRVAVEEKGQGIDDLGLWYGRRIGSKKMGYEERTALTIAAMYGSSKVVSYIVDSGKVDVNRAAGSDRVTALHCAVAGGAVSSPRIVELLLRSNANPNCVDGNGNLPCKLIPRTPNSTTKQIQMLLNGDGIAAAAAAIHGEVFPEEALRKKEYPVDTSLPDINTGLYSTDEFRMYSFKIKPCSRAYTHDWTECPFAHPGENARRRDPRKYQYSCVPCPEFRRGACKNGEDCEYAHGVFESWLHPAQYRTRLCKDEIGCARKVCFFAHKKEELRPVYAATGSAIPSPSFSSSMSGLDIAVVNQIGQFSTAPMSPTLSPSSPKWLNRVSSPAPPSLQLQGSRLRSSLNARDVDLEIKLLRLENQINQQQQLQLREEIYGRTGEFKATGLGSLSSNSSLFASFGDSQLLQLDSPNFSQNLSFARGCYPTTNPSSPVKKVPSKRLDTSPPKSAAAAMLSPRSAAFAKQRSQSFINHGALAASIAITGFDSGRGANTANSLSANLSDWGSPDGRLDWGIKGEELSKLKKSASFAFGGNNGVKAPTSMVPLASQEPDISWVNSLVKDAPSGIERGQFRPRVQPYGSNNAVQELCLPLMDQLYIEEQMVA
ncbi:hypothetical protein Dimus_033560 [Dionaea muscipula]